MFTARYWTRRYFAARYWPKIGETVVVTRFVSLSLAARPSYALGAVPEHTVSPRPALEVA
jgi:hypothetical protein